MVPACGQVFVLMTLKPDGTAGGKLLDALHAGRDEPVQESNRTSSQGPAGRRVHGGGARTGAGLISVSPRSSIKCGEKLAFD